MHEHAHLFRNSSWLHSRRAAVASVSAAAYYTILIAVGEFFYRWNIKTPLWVGFIFQRPESHRVHHQFRHHTNNFADIPLWGMLFGTFKNPKMFKGQCGYERWR